MEAGVNFTCLIFANDTIQSGPLTFTLTLCSLISCDENQQHPAWYHSSDEKKWALHHFTWGKRPSQWEFGILFMSNGKQRFWGWQMDLVHGWQQCSCSCTGLRIIQDKQFDIIYIPKHSDYQSNSISIPTYGHQLWTQNPIQVEIRFFYRVVGLALSDEAQQLRNCHFSKLEGASEGGLSML